MNDWSQTYSLVLKLASARGISLSSAFSLLRIPNDTKLCFERKAFLSDTTRHSILCRCKSLGDLQSILTPDILLTYNCKLYVTNVLDKCIYGFSFADDTLYGSDFLFFSDFETQAYQSHTSPLRNIPSLLPFCEQGFLLVYDGRHDTIYTYEEGLPLPCGVVPLSRLINKSSGSFSDTDVFNLHYTLYTSNVYDTLFSGNLQSYPFFKYRGRSHSDLTDTIFWGIDILTPTVVGL